MAITTLTGYTTAKKQRLIYQKTTARTATSLFLMSLFDLAGNPGAGTLAIGNTTTGVVPTDATTGYPTINTPSNTLYLSGIMGSGSVACNIHLYDCLYSVGAFAFNATALLSSQPSYSGRLPNTGDYNNLELWWETVTAFTGNPSLAVTYTDQDGNAGATTGTVALGTAPILGKMIQIPLASGDCGLQKIESVTATVATVGTFNLHVMRYLGSIRVSVPNEIVTTELFKTGMPKIFGDSAIRMFVQADNNSTGTPQVQLTLIDG